MPEPRPEVLEFLQTRRSRPARTLTKPVPGRDGIERLLVMAARSPDHGKLVPWRFIVLEKVALLRLGALVGELGPDREREPGRLEKARRQFADADLVIAVVSRPMKSDKVPEVEQILSAGAVCLGLLNAALASGWGANWLTGWMARDREFLARGLGLARGEFVAGFIHVGTETIVPPERPRPDVAALTTWVQT